MTKNKTILVTGGCGYIGSHCVVQLLDHGYSVLEAVRSFEKAIQIDLNIKFCSRRDGDIPISFASTLKAENDLNWTAKVGLDEMMSDLFEWSKNNL